MALSGLGTWGSGGTPSRNDPDAFGPGIPWLKIGDLKDGPVRAAAESITNHGLASSAAKLLDAGTLLVAMYGSIGKLGITTFPCATNQAIASCVPRTGADLRYLFYALLNERQHLLGLGQGGTQLNISQTLLKAHEINVAPVKEQQRIVSRIEELLSEIDEGERALERVGQLVEHYRQSVLKAAVTGELTQEWRARNSKARYESGRELLQRILQGRQAAWERDELAKMAESSRTPRGDAWKLRYRHPHAPLSEGLPDLPDEWSWASPSQLDAWKANALTIGPFGSDLKVSDYRTEGVPLVFVRNIRSGEFGGTTGKFIDPTKASLLSSHLVRSGDLLITKMGDPPGDACVYPQGMPDAVVTADCIKWSICTLLPSAPFIQAVINSPLGRSQFKRITKGVAQQKVTLDAFRQLAIPLPGPDEQLEIERLLEKEMSRLDAVSGQVATEARRSAALRQSILKAAFSGQLVPQDPRDEPASALLARLAAQAAEAPAAPRRRSAPRKNALA